MCEILITIVYSCGRFKAMDAVDVKMDKQMKGEPKTSCGFIQNNKDNWKLFEVAII